MKQPIQIQFHGMEASPVLEAAAREKAGKLDRYFDELMACRVDIELQHKHHHQGRPYAVRVDLTLRGHEITASRVHHEDVYEALRDAFDRIRRQLEDVVQQDRGEKKQHAIELQGEVVRLDDDGDYGFIRSPDGDEYYFGRENMANLPFEHLQIGSRVHFVPELAAEGRQAKRVSVAKH